MSDILRSFVEAWKLIISFDGEVYGVIGLTLAVTIASTVVSALIAIPLGVIVGSRKFRGKKLLVRIINTLMGLPPVVAGLIVYLTLSRKGPLGSLQLLFTPTAMVTAQVIIVTPIMAGLIIGAVKLKVREVEETCKGIGLTPLKTLFMLLYECRYPVISALLAGYGRAISEVGAVMLVGGNIQYETRVMTTSIVLETGKGNYDVALSLGIILLIISFIINWIIQRFQEEL